MRVAGVLLLNVTIAGAETISVPFLVTPTNITLPVIGYNVIEHVILNSELPLPPLLNAALLCLNNKKAEAVIDLIQYQNELGDVRC